MSDKEDKLYFALVNNDPKQVEKLVKGGVSVNVFYRSTGLTWSALHVCAAKGHYECAEVLLRHGAQVNVTDTWGLTPLMNTIVSEWTEVLDLFLSYGANVDMADSNGHTSVHLALKCSELTCLKKICEAGANLNRRDLLGRTPLWHCASEDGKLAQLKYLLSIGANASMIDAKDKFTPLQAAVWYTNEDKLEYIEALMEKCGCKSPSHSKNTILMTIVQKNWGNEYDISPQEAALVERMLDDGCDVNVCSNGVYKGVTIWNKMRRGTALKMAANRGAITMVRILLDAGANPNIQDVDGVAPIHMAVFHSHIGCAGLLLGANCRLDLTARIHIPHQHAYLDNISPFGCALETANMKMAQLLVAGGYNLQKEKYFIDPDNWPEALKDAPEILCWMMDVICGIDDLGVLCRKCIRSILGLGIKSKVQCLPLPTFLKNYILLKDIIDDLV